MMKQVQRVLATVAVTALLGLGGGVLATPASAADVDVSVLGDTLGAAADGVIGLTAVGTHLVTLPNPVGGTI